MPFISTPTKFIHVIKLEELDGNCMYVEATVEFRPISQSNIADVLSFRCQNWIVFPDYFFLEAQVYK